jgi:ATP-dependent DNA helicase RecG
MKLTDEIRWLKGVGPSRAALLSRLGIGLLGELLLHLPRAWLDRRFVVPISSVRVGESMTIAGVVLSIHRRRSGRGRAILEALVSDGTPLRLVFFNERYPAALLEKGMQVVASGTVENWRGMAMVHPDLLLPASDREPEAPGMLPLYPLTAGLTQGVMRRIVGLALSELEPPPAILPADILSEGGFADRLHLLRGAHHPADPDEARRARDLLALEELYLYRRALALVRRSARSEPAVPLLTEPLTAAGFATHLPWPLTSAQERVIDGILQDLSLRVPMRRLVQGDVGSGKTVAAAAACARCALSGMTAVLLAPTEVLAVQHFKSLRMFLSDWGIPVRLLTGGTGAVARRELSTAMTESPACVLVGTHAVLEDWVPLDRLALLVVDEQHKFGVMQREKLTAGRVPRPHVLIMSATPIPRTLAMTLYGDLDLSVIDEMPPGRGRVVTRVIGEAEKRELAAFILDRLAAGERAFMVYPLKEMSENIPALDAETAFERVRNGPLGRWGAVLLHGGMPPGRKVEAVTAFATGRARVLVSTTVIEVGIDVPQATVMVVSGAGRFGLSQLHQLRGRIGRGGADSFCFLVLEEHDSSASRARLEALAQTSDGFQVAGKDLELRGPGQVLGTRQHGLPEFRVADLSRDIGLMERLEHIPDSGDTELADLIREESWRFGGLSFPGT